MDGWMDGKCEKFCLKCIIHLFHTGSCTLHIVHGAFKTGLKDGAGAWEVAKTLRSMYHLLKDSPARRDEYAKHAVCFTDEEKLKPIFPLA